MDPTYQAMLVEKMDAVLTELGEHYDAIQIIGTMVDDEGLTHRITRGRGNWYARQGVAREFLEMDAAQTTAHEIAKVMPKTNPPDDGENWKTDG